MDESQSFRVPPHNFEAEMALLGAILTNNKAFDTVHGIVKVEDFASAEHAAIFDAITKLKRMNIVADPVTLKQHFEDGGLLEAVGGTSYLAKLAAAVISVVNAEDYARTIADRALRRRLIEIGERLVDSAHHIEIDETAHDIAAGATNAIMREASSMGGGRQTLTLYEVARAAVDTAASAMRDGTGLVGVPTGLRVLDDVLGGLRPGRLYIVGGRPGMGKTTFATNITANVAEALLEDGSDHAHRIYFAQLEMEEDEMGALVLSARTAIAASRILRGQLSMDEFNQVYELAQQFHGRRFWIDCRAKQTIGEITASARLAKPDLVVVDHLLLVDGDFDERARRSRSKVELTGEVAQALKNMAKELRCPVIALCQLKRPEQGKEDRRPVLEDLKWAGEIEAAADAVLFLYRAAYYLERIPESERTIEEGALLASVRDTCEVLIAKHRGGAGANKTVRLFFDPAKGQFTDLAEAPQPGQLHF